MRFCADRRGQAVQIGAILLFAALIVSLATYQAFVVPAENEDTEFGDFQTAAEDLATLQAALLDAAAGTTRTVTVHTGSLYPSRTFSVNPPPPRGVLETSDRREATLVNARAAAGEATNTRSYFDGTNRSFTTRFLEFAPDYNEFDAPPVVVSGVAGFRVFDGSISPDTPQTLMQGSRITLVTVAGDLRTRGLSGSVTVEPVSAATRTITITGDHGGTEPVGLRLPVSNRTTADAWIGSSINDSLPDRYVRAVEREATADGEYVNVTLRPDRTYTLRIARVEVREKGDSGVTTDPSAKYTIPVEGDNASVSRNQTVQLAAEVRDRFNNPVSGVNVSFAVDNDDGGGALLASIFEPATPENSTTTDSDGRAAKRFSPSAAGTAYVNASFGGPGLNSTNHTVSVSVPGGAGSGSGNDEINPGTSGSIILDGQSDAGNGETDLTVTLKNSTQSSSLVEITEARMSFYFNGDSGAGDVDPTEVDLYSTEQGVGSGSATTLPFGSDFRSLGTQIPLDPESGGDDDLTTLDLSFPEEVEADDFYVLALKFSNGETFTYFVSHSGGGGGATTATDIAPVSASTNNDGTDPGSNVTFVLENTGGSDATVTGVAVNSTSTPGGYSGNDAPDRVQRGGGDGIEVKSNRTGGTLDTTITIDDQSPELLDTDGTIPAGEQTRFWLADFENVQGGGNFVDMSGNDVTVTVLFADGSQKEFTFTNL